MGQFCAGMFKLTFDHAAGAERRVESEAPLMRSEGEI